METKQTKSDVKLPTLTPNITIKNTTGFPMAKQG